MPDDYWVAHYALKYGWLPSQVQEQDLRALVMMDATTSARNGASAEMERRRKDGSSGKSQA